jgi:CRISPR-associated protein Cst2
MQKVKKLTHIAGTFLIDANASFLNGAGIAVGERENYTKVKTFFDGWSSKGRYQVPFVSAASWRRWLRDTLIEETGWKESVIRALHKNAKGNTDKIGTERDPIEFAEDDLFGYMFPIPKEAAKLMAPVEEEEDEDTDVGEADSGTKAIGGGAKIRGLFRTSPFSTSILVGLRKDGWEGIDENYVSLVEGSSQPYKTQFMNTALQGVFCLNYARLGVFANIGDRQELDSDMIKKYLGNKTLIEREKPGYFSLEKESPQPSAKPNGTEQTGTDKDNVQKKGKARENFKVVVKPGTVYEIANTEVRKERASELLKALAILRGGAKQAAFGTDVSPKLIIMAGLSCGNPIFNSLFEDESFDQNRGRSVVLNKKAMNEIVEEYSDRIVTPVYIGMRTGYMKNEDEIKALESTSVNGIKFIVTTPRNAAECMSKFLELGPIATTTASTTRTESTQSQD